MNFDKTKLFIAGCTDGSEYDCPDLVWVYFINDSETLPDNFFKFYGGSNGISPGDSIIVGPKGEDGKIIFSQAVLYNAVGTYIASIHQVDWDFFRWIEELDKYKPHTSAEGYWQSASNRWKQQDVGYHKGKRLQGCESEATCNRPPYELF